MHASRKLVSKLGNIYPMEYCTAIQNAYSC